MKLSQRQEEIIRIVKEGQPVTSEALTGHLGATRAALRADLTILTMIGIFDARPKAGYVHLGEAQNTRILENIFKTLVGEIMSRPATVSEEATVYDAIVFLFLNDVGTSFVESSGVLVSVVSRKDFLKNAIGGTDIHGVSIGVITTRMPNIICEYAEDSAYSLAKKIIEHEIDSIPIVEKIETTANEKNQFKIIGKISKTNITGLFVKLGGGN